MKWLKNWGWLTFLLLCLAALLWMLCLTGCAAVIHEGPIHYPPIWTTWSRAEVAEWLNAPKDNR